MKIARKDSGFTLLELIVVISIIGILAAIAVPNLMNRPIKAKEVVLKHNLLTIRDVIDQFYGDKGHYPPSFEILVDEGYLRVMPLDPVTQATDTWVPIYEEFDPDSQPAETDLNDAGEPGIIDVQSGAEGEASDGTLYSDW